RTVRVVGLHGDSNWGPTLRCDLLHESLDNPVEYEGISYEWLWQTQSRPLYCEDKTLPATENCEAALKRSHPSDISESRLLWIDGACINQMSSAMKERSHQVKMIG
ncbi:hypothetical protein K469DRAFT_778654, partial [Zopfia rhizophila CBS 207.26]